jgi:hypothetical protein
MVRIPLPEMISDGSIRVGCQVGAHGRQERIRNTVSASWPRAASDGAASVPPGHPARNCSLAHAKGGSDLCALRSSMDCRQHTFA